VIGSDVDPGAIISDALLPRRPASPNAALVLASGLSLGLLIGLAGLYLLERRDGRCYDWRTVERRLGLAVLADVPGTQGDPAPLFEPHSAGAESFAELRNALLVGLGSERATLVVAAPTDGFSADVVVANLGVALARAGHVSSIVVADERSHIPVMFGLPATEGLTEVLRKRVSLASALQDWPDLRALHVLPAGHGLQSEVADLEGSGASELLDDLAKRSHFVIVRARPTDEGADAQFFGRSARAAIPAIEIGRTVRDSVAAGVRQWRLVGTTVPGAVTLPAFEAPEPPPPRAVTSPSGSTAASGASRSSGSSSSGPSSPQAPRNESSESPNSDTDREQLRKAPPPQR
jgi:Mrp family chromosome partitioning ATPase